MINIAWKPHSRSDLIVELDLEANVIVVREGGAQIDVPTDDVDGLTATLEAARDQLIGNEMEAQGDD